MTSKKFRRNPNAALVRKIREQQKIEEKSQRNDNMSKIHIAMVGIYFLSNLYIIGEFNHLDLSLVGLFKLVALLLGLGLLFPIKIYRKWLTISIYEYLILNLIAIAPLLCALIIFTNDTFKSDVYYESYKIEKSEWVKGKIIFYLENNQYDEKEYLRSIKDNEEFEKFGTENLAIFFSDGLWGIRIIEKKRVH